ncbi:MAG TPA: universal stress protein [Gaiellaceae bacterium]|nr:universal stress protein [Gaiellaceae bacterium]
MDSAANTAENAAAARASVFDRIVVGVDGSEPGFEAARQVRRLLAPRGWLEVFTAVHTVEANRAGWSASRLAAEFEREGREALRRGLEIAGPNAKSRFVDGPPARCLLHELQERETTLVAVGTHGHRRSAEILIGGVCGEVLHRAPCSVLVARQPPATAVFPGTIVAGFDGSPEGRAAVTTARRLAERFGASLSIVTALGGKDVDLDRARLEGALEVPEAPVAALVGASSGADILVVGSRGLHGVRALGSVSERVAHSASSSVLVVRSPPTEATERG